MRIRSIKPEFWRSDDITAIEDWSERLIFIGLWSYVDDNGVGMDKLSAIAADLFAGDLEGDPRETFARVSRGLQTLSEQGRITRYTVDGKAYLHITNWDRHQRIDKPNKERYPLPTCENVEIRDTLATPSRHPRETPAPGTEEQRNRGTEEQAPRRDAGDFDSFWDAYPRKAGKGQAVKAYRAALKKVDHDTLMAGLSAARKSWQGTDQKFIPYPATWLNGERWADVASVPAEPDDPYAGLPSVEERFAEIDAMPACPECTRRGGSHFQGCSQWVPLLERVGRQ